MPHGLEVNATVIGAPLNTVQQWPGHADPKSSIVYGDAIGADEERMRRANG
jgi:hypothetical protein